MDRGVKLGSRPAVGPPDPDGDSSTRARVARTIGARGPITAAGLAGELGLTPAAVRRHLDAMDAQGLLDVAPAPGGQRGRGRPARAYVLSTSGHASLTSAYDDLAVSLLRYLRDRVGGEAVEDFAVARGRDLEIRYGATVARAGTDPVRRAQVLAEALSVDGYAATSRSVELPTGTAVQLCQGHCPVQHVAAEFPALCEAETAAFTRILGSPVRRLATLAQGGHACTTHVSTHTTDHLPEPNRRTR